ncbi:bone morphogenetic protein receptor type-2-like [Centruroides vittatus]|uniref:bone morphogenetic protein receptor type-2-like n=1 Tax=Centruroides vittatus TaxID=120091 RepID=UPI00350FFF74
MLKARFYLLCFFYVIFIGSCRSERLCVYHKDASVKYSALENSDDDEEKDGSMSIELSNTNNTQLCSDSTIYCYALWTENAQNKTFIMTQGCWSNMQDDCGQSECRASKRFSKSSNITKFCCCSGNFCNANISDTDDVPFSDESDDVQSALQFVEQASYNTKTVIIVLSTIFTAVILGILACLIVRCWHTTQKPSPDSIHLMEAPPPTTPIFDLDSLKIQDVIGQGHYGSVCEGSLHNQTVAVKIFNVQNKQYFLNERDIYTLPFMDHPSLPKFLGSEERIGSDGKLEFLLVLTFAPLGCLHDYLVKNVIDWPTLCKMAQTITKGLSHLHTEIKKGDKLKMCVAHRDLTSRNVLVKSDGSCMLCDFGFGIRVSGSKYYQNGEKQTAETSSLADVGTLRYMAPEVLEGAVNLRDCESSLKQIDVYALGLVLWEIATRCSDLFQGMEVPDYKAPFEVEVGSHPTMEQMQVLVARHKARPLFPDIWKDTNPAVRALKETIEDCWDHDAEARLTALCAEERLLELPNLWERHKAGMTVPGVSPTVNPTSSGHSIGMHGGVLSSSSSSQATASTGITSDLSDRFLSQGDIPNNIPPRSIERASSMSENTVETLLTMSPSESIPSELHFNNSIMNTKNNLANNSANKCPRLTVPLQPHQGRNPCIERNLMMEPLEEVSISGNMLLDRGLKYKEQRLTQNLADHNNETDSYDVQNMIDSVESNALVTSDLLNHSSRNCHPIPYLQNDVHLTTIMPKQPNLPGNGHHFTNGKVEQKQKEKWWKSFGVFDRKKHNGAEQSGFKSGLKNLFRKGKSDNQQTIQKKPLSSNNICMHQNTTSEYSPVVKEIYVNKLQNSTEPIETEVCVVNKGQSCSTTQTMIRRVTSVLPHGFLEKSAEVKTKLCSENNLADSQPTAETENLSTIVIHKDINGNCSNDIPKRPTTLPVQSYTVKNNENNLQCEQPIDKKDIQLSRGGSSGRQKIVKRVKTPFEIKKGRFSLYDDRIMVSESMQVKPTEHLELNGASKISVSLPLDIDTLCASQADSFLQECHQTKQEME